MALRIEPVPSSVSLRISGDVETLLTVPFDDDDRFLVGVSDGTLLLGTYNEDLRCGWELARQGEGEVRFDPSGVIVHGSLEWVTVSLYDPNVVEPKSPMALPLFPDLDRWAA